MLKQYWNINGKGKGLLQACINSVHILVTTPDEDYFVKSGCSCQTPSHARSCTICRHALTKSVGTLTV